jgi:hypothetical protein
LPPGLAGPTYSSRLENPREMRMSIKEAIFPYLFLACFAGGFMLGWVI